LKGNREAHSMFERQLDGERWVLVNEHRTEEGTAALYTDISELKRREREILHLAYHDALTNLPNRVLFSRARRGGAHSGAGRGTTVAVMCLALITLRT